MKRFWISFMIGVSLSLTGCGSQTPAVSPGATHRPALRTESVIEVIQPDPKVHPSQYEFRPGGKISIDGRVHDPAPAEKSLSVQLFWAAPNIHHLIRAQTFAIQSNGNFAGDFKVPNGGFVGGGGGEFTLEFSYGNAKPVDVQLAIPAASAAK